MNDNSKTNLLCLISAAVLLFTGSGISGNASNGREPSSSLRAFASPVSRNIPEAESAALPGGARQEVDASLNDAAAAFESIAGAGAASGQDFEGTKGVTEKQRLEGMPVVMTRVRTSSNRGFDRVVFEFEGARLPGYRVEYVDRPSRWCAGEGPSLPGKGWLMVRFMPAQAHTEKGKSTISLRDRRFRFPVLRRLVSTCDFEADVEWVFGLSSPNRYRVIELSNPTRLVVDVKHKNR
jgi:hypothetical protein